MTVKIVEAPPLRAKCGTCGAILEYEPEDTRERTWSDYGGGTNHRVYVKCPRNGCNGEARIRGD